MYYVLNDPGGQSVTFVKSDTQESGSILVDPLGDVISNTLPATLVDSLAGHLDPATGLQYHGGRYYDAWLGGYVQPNSFGGLPGMPQSLNRFSVGSGLMAAHGMTQAEQGHLPSLVVDIGISVALNSGSALFAGRWLQPIPGRLVSQIASWHWLRITAASYIRNSEQVPYFIGLYAGKQVSVGAWSIQWSKTSARATTRNVLVRDLPDDFDATLKTLSRRGVSVIERPFGLIPGRIWNFGFGLDKVKPGLGQHFRVGGLATGGIADALVGGLWQGISDQYYYNLWSTDPGLAARRAGVNATVNAAVGLAGASLTGGVFALAVAAGASTPPGWVVLGTTAVVTAGIGVFTPYDDMFKDFLLETFDAMLPSGN